MTEIRFYRPQDDYGFLTNYSPHPVNLDGYIWATTEHFYAAQKTLHDPTRDAIREAPTPRKAMDLGRACECRADWHEIVEVAPALSAMFSDQHGVIVERTKDHFMFSGLVAKFVQHADIRTLLLKTEDATLTEASPTDAYWGDANGGLNKLGRMLMLVRRRIQEGVLDGESTTAP